MNASSVEAAQVDILYGQLPWALVANVLAGILLVVVLRQLVDIAPLVIWIGLLCVVSVMRWAALQLYRNRRPDASTVRAWCWLHLALTFLAGLVWGSAAPLFALSGDPLRLLMVALPQVGMVAGAVSSLAAVRGAFPIYMLPVGVPLSIVLLASGDQVHGLMGTMVAVYMVVMLGMAKRLHETILESLRLRFSNDELISNLQTTSSQLEDEAHTRERMENLIQQSEQRLRLHVAQTPLAVIDWDLKFQVTAWNPAAERMFGYPAEEAIGRRAWELIISPGAREDVWLVWQELLCRRGGVRSTNENLTKSGHTIVCEWYNTPLVDASGQVLGVASLVQDITARREAERQLERLANYDELTGLPNRSLFHDRLGHALEKSRRRKQQLAVLFADLDNFKMVNDTLGHGAGDRLLRHVADTVREVVRDEDTVARLGGDEFIILMEEVSPFDVSRAVQRLVEALDRPLVLDRQEISAAASIGIAVYPNDGEDIDTLLKNADTAMYRAKDSDERYQFFRADMATKTRERLDIESRLRRAVERDQFHLNFQPVVSLESGALQGAEALLRWTNPELGLVPPDRFIPVAESSGLIAPIGEWVLRAVCRQVTSWSREGMEAPRIAINLSARQLRQRGLAGVFSAVMREEGIDPSRIGIELTESALMQNADEAAEILWGLRGLGLEISVDDFGTGYSSLSYLKRFPIDKLKIDRSFVNELSHGGENMAIVVAILGVAQALGMQVVAEGIETSTQLTLLRERGCDLGQGYHISRPMMAEDFAAWMRAKGGTRQLGEAGA